jgi:hypothetical protein
MPSTAYLVLHRALGDRAADSLSVGNRLVFPTSPRRGWRPKRTSSAIRPGHHARTASDFRLRERHGPPDGAGTSTACRRSMQHKVLSRASTTLRGRRRRVGCPPAVSTYAPTLLGNEAIVPGENEASQTDWLGDLCGGLGPDPAAGGGGSSTAAGRSSAGYRQIYGGRARWLRMCRRRMSAGRRRRVFTVRALCSDAGGVPGDAGGEGCSRVSAWRLIPVATRSGSSEACAS